MLEISVEASYSHLQNKKKPQLFTSNYIKKDEEEQMGLKCNYLDLETHIIQTCSMKLFIVDSRLLAEKKKRKN